MTTRALLRDRLAPAVGRVIVKHALGADAATIAGPFLDWLSSTLKGRDEAQQALRFADDIGRRVVDGLVPVFESEHSPGLNPEAVALALGETLDAHFDAGFMVAHDLDAARITAAAFELRSLSHLKRAAYSSDDRHLYRRALPLLVERLVPEARQFTGFEVANAAEVLKRLRELAEQGRRVEEGVGFLVRARQVWERRRAEQWRQFEKAYADATLDRWNKLDLFGIEVSSEVQRRQKLSIAYIALNLQSEDDDGSGTGLASFEELLATAARERRPLVILGEAGGGKTTLLRWAACEAVNRAAHADPSAAFADDRAERSQRAMDLPRPERTPGLAWWARVPFLLRLREVKDAELPSEAQWPGKSSGLTRDPPAEWLDEVLGGGHGLILLDGLDELGSQGRDIARDALRAMLRDQRGNLVVLTSRPGAFEVEWFEGIPVHVATIRAMSPAQREACVSNWHEAVAQAKPAGAADIRQRGTELINKLRINPYLQEPTTNPLICAATCALHYGREGYLPNGLVELFDSLCKMLVHDREQQQNLIERAHVPEPYRRLDYGHKRQLLEEIAADMVLNGESQRTRPDALVSLRERLAAIPDHRHANPEEILKGLLLRSGLLRPSGGNDIDFLHNTFKEYLAAARFLSRRWHARLVEAADGDPGDAVFVYAYAIASARGEEALTEELISQLLDRVPPDEEIRRRRQILGIRCRGLTLSAAPPVQARFDRLIEEVLPPRDAAEAEAVATLGDETVDRLYWPDAAPEIAAACAHALVTIGTDRAREALLAYKNTAHQAVAEELALAFNPLELPYWMTRVTQDPEARGWRPALPDAVARRVTTLEPLLGVIGLERLDLRGPAVADLGPLRALTGLQTLFLSNTAVADLEPLRGLTGLQTLALNNTAVADLAPLRGLTGLQALDLSNTAVADLAPLRALTGLQTLALNNTAVADLAPLRALTGLQALHLDNTAVADLEPLRGLTGLQALILDNTAVTDLEPLRGLIGLQTLFLSNTAVADLEPLRGLTGLTRLQLDSTAVADLEPLRGLTALTSLHLDNTAVADLVPLRGLTALTSLHLDNTAVADLRSLRGLSDLQWLSLDNTAISNLEPLRGLIGLQTLFLSNTAVADLEPLRGLTGLTRLDLANTAVADLEPVRHIMGLWIFGGPQGRDSTHHDP